jgi:hypothetical protein
MKRIFGILSLTFVLAIAAVAQTPAATQNQAEKLSKKQLLSLIATAKTPADHRRIAQYYEARAQDYLAQSKEHKEMAAQYKANGAISTKWATGTVGHCEYFAKYFQDVSVKMQEMAGMHEQLAKDAERD